MEYGKEISIGTILRPRSSDRSIAKPETIISPYLTFLFCISQPMKWAGVLHFHLLDENHQSQIALQLFLSVTDILPLLPHVCCA